MTERIEQARALLRIEPHERPLIRLSTFCGAGVLWLAIALGKWWLLIELPILAALTVWLLGKRRRRESLADEIEDWSFF